MLSVLSADTLFSLSESEESQKSGGNFTRAKTRVDNIFYADITHQFSTFAWIGADGGLFFNAESFGVRNLPKGYENVYFQRRNECDHQIGRYVG